MNYVYKENIFGVWANSERRELWLIADQAIYRCKIMVKLTELFHCYFEKAIADEVVLNISIGDRAFF